MNFQLSEKCFSQVVWIKIKLYDETQTRCYFTANIDTEFIDIDINTELLELE